MTSRHKKKAKPAKQDSKLRIIGGKWRSRCLSFPEIEGLRPSGSRIRETLFNWLQPVISNARCLDMYAGSGALSFEAISRGAKYCQLIEMNTIAIRHLTESAQLLNTSRADIVHSNALEHLNTPPPQPFDIVFIDPPFSENLWAQTAQLLSDNQWLSKHASIYIETPSQGTNQSFPWKLIKQKKAGQILYSLYTNE